MNHMERVLLTDVDNTLFSWIDFFAPCFRALVHAVAREGGFPEDELYNSFKLVFQKEGTVEYRKALQDNDLIKNLSKEKQERLIYIGSVAFSRAMPKHLKPYDGVKETLRELRADNVYIVAVTNSGALQAIDRLRRLGLSKLLNGLVAWNHDVTGIIEDNAVFEQLVQARLRNSGLPWAIILPSENLKPNTSAYEYALRRLKLHSAKVWVVGDSLHKDLSPAIGINAISIWAQYGHAFVERNFDTLLRITHWSNEKIASTYDTTILKPDHTIKEFSSLIDIIGLSQRKLF